MSKFSLVRFRLLVAWSAHTVVFLPVFRFLVISVQFILILPVLFLVAITNLPPCLFIWSSSGCIDASWILATSLPLLFLAYSLSTSSRGWKALCIVMSFLVLWFICWSSSLVHAKNGPNYLKRAKVQVFIFRWDSCYVVWFRVVFSFSRAILFLYFSVYNIP